MCSFTDITDPPQDYNVSLNGIIELNCTAVANTFFWRENGQQLDNGINGVDIIIGVVDKARNIRMSTLRVPATDNAAVNYTCIAVTTNPFEQDVSDPAVVRKQGNSLLMAVHKKERFTCRSIQY